MKKLLAVPLMAALIGSGCVAPTAGGAVAVMPPGAVVELPGAHVHSLQCPHFWGYYGGRPVYYVGDQYIYWQDGNWVALKEEPEHGAHHHYIVHSEAHTSVPPGFWQ
jgi:hypothetical protein